MSKFIHSDLPSQYTLCLFSPPIPSPLYSLLLESCSPWSEGSKLKKKQTVCSAGRRWGKESPSCINPMPIIFTFCYRIRKSEWHAEESPSATVTCIFSVHRDSEWSSMRVYVSVLDSQRQNKPFMAPNACTGSFATGTRVAKLWVGRGDFFGNTRWGEYGRSTAEENRRGFHHAKDCRVN